MAPQITLITGCSSGIGLALAVKLAQEPGKPYIVYATMRNLAKKDALEKAAGGALNDTLHILQLDVTKEDQVKRAFADVMAKHERIDVLVNNAGVGYVGPFESMPFQKAKDLFDINFFGTVRMTQEALPVMRKQRSGRIVNISSILGVVASPFLDIYSASKFAMEGLTSSLAPPLEEFNVWISTIQPGPVSTEFGTNLVPAEAGADPVMMEQMASYFKSLKGAMREPQTTEPVIETIVECLKAERPKMRYPTSEMVREVMKEMYTDGIGAVRLSTS